MKRLTAFLLVALIGWNIVLTILYLQSKENSTAAGAAQQTNQKVESASVDITSDVTELVAKSENKVVTVTAKARGQSIDSGSGAVYKVDGKTVYIITNNHVVADGDEAIVTFANGKEQKVEIVGKDELTDLVEGFGFALPINEVLPIITELENNGKVVRPILGISVQPIEQLSMLDKAYLGIDSKVESGLLIVKVASRTPAAAAGIKEGDILVKFDGKDIKDYKQFRQYLYSHKVKDKVSIVVNRNGKEIEKTVILE